MRLTAPARQIYAGPGWPAPSPEESSLVLPELRYSAALLKGGKEGDLVSCVYDFSGRAEPVGGLGWSKGLCTGFYSLWGQVRIWEVARRKSGVFLIFVDLAYVDGHFSEWRHRDFLSLGILRVCPKCTQLAWEWF